MYNFDVSYQDMEFSLNEVNEYFLLAFFTSILIGVILTIAFFPGGLYMLAGLSM